MLDYEPEPMDVLKSRYPDALRDIFVPKRVQKNPDLSPGKKRKHVFDFEDGLRLIISVDQAKGIRVTHYSASMYPENRFTDIQTFCEFAVKHINELRDKAMTGALTTALGEGGLLHLLYNESQPPMPLANPLWN